MYYKCFLQFYKCLQLYVHCFTRFCMSLFLFGEHKWVPEWQCSSRRIVNHTSVNNRFSLFCIVLQVFTTVFYCFTSVYNCFPLFYKCLRLFFIVLQVFTIALQVFTTVFHCLSSVFYCFFFTVYKWLQVDFLLFSKCLKCFPLFYK